MFTLIMTLFGVQQVHTPKVMGKCAICDKPIYVGGTCVCEHEQYFCSIACADQYITEDEFFAQLVGVTNNLGTALSAFVTG